MDDGIAVNIIKLESVPGSGVGQGGGRRRHFDAAAENCRFAAAAVGDGQIGDHPRPWQGGALKDHTETVEDRQFAMGDDCRREIGEIQVGGEIRQLASDVGRQR